MKSDSMKPSGVDRLVFLADCHSKGFPINIKTQDAAALTGLSVSNLNLLRLKGGEPRFQKFGRSVRYRLADVMAFIVDTPTYSSSSEISASTVKREKVGVGAAA